GVGKACPEGEERQKEPFASGSAAPAAPAGSGQRMPVARPAIREDWPGCRVQYLRSQRLCREPAGSGPARSVGPCCQEADMVTVPSREPSTLEIRLFGGLELRKASGPLPRTRTRAGQWLLALLALRPDREVERAWLAGVLWPDS